MRTRYNSSTYWTNVSTALLLCQIRTCFRADQYLSFDDVLLPFLIILRCHLSREIEGARCDRNFKYRVRRNERSSLLPIVPRVHHHGSVHNSCIERLFESPSVGAIMINSSLAIASSCKCSNPFYVWTDEKNVRQSLVGENEETIDLSREARHVHHDIHSLLH